MYSAERAVKRKRGIGRPSLKALAESAALAVANG
jgi:hypothetical protein